MVSKKIQEIWNMGARRCTECGLVKPHCAHGMCDKCYNKDRVKTNGLKK